MKKASFTVEAALLMPVLLLVIFGILTLNFHLMNRGICLAEACEEAISDKEDEPFLLMWADSPKRYESGDEKLRRVTFSSKTSAVFGGYGWDFEESAEYRKTSPVSTIRKMKCLSELINKNDKGD